MDAESTVVSYCAVALSWKGTKKMKRKQPVEERVISKEHCVP